MSTVQYINPAGLADLFHYGYTHIEIDAVAAITNSY
jgi:hypothetical protein